MDERAGQGVTWRAVASILLAAGRGLRQPARMDQAVYAFETPAGPFSVTERGGEIIAAGWQDGVGGDATPLLREARDQVMAYWAGGLTRFDLPLRVDGPDLVVRLCTALQAIPFGETLTYGDLAKSLRRPAQAIGQACGQNPIPLIIPCHRVLSATGLGGFSAPGGVETKVTLLRHEGAAGLLI